MPSFTTISKKPGCRVTHDSVRYPTCIPPIGIGSVWWDEFPTVPQSPFFGSHTLDVTVGSATMFVQIEFTVEVGS